MEACLATLSDDPTDSLYKKATTERIALWKKRIRETQPFEMQISSTRGFLERARRRKLEHETTIANAQSALRAIEAEIVA